MVSKSGDHDVRQKPRSRDAPGDDQCQTRGDVIVVSYADHNVVGFRTQVQAQQFLVPLQERLAVFSLSLNVSRIRLLDYGLFAARDRRKRALGKPEAFDSLGFTHCCSTNRSVDFEYFD
jgi:hypothetical protein